jgi:ribonucleoside-triphosphate reductase
MHDEEFGVKVKSIFDNITASQAKDSDLKRDNANINGDTAMGAMLQYGANTAKEYNLNWLIDPEIARLHKEGWIHIHDLDFYAWTTTCTQIELRKLFKGGFNTGHGQLREPKGIGSYAALAAIAIQSNQNDQHGGQSIVDFDYAMGDGVRITYQRYLKEAFQLQADLGGKTDIPWREQYALKKTPRDTYQEWKLITTSIRCTPAPGTGSVQLYNYGTIPVGRPARDRAAAIGDEAGLGNGETRYPHSDFRVKEGVNYNPSDPNYDLFRLAMETRPAAFPTSLS